MKTEVTRAEWIKGAEGGQPSWLVTICETAEDIGEIGPGFIGKQREQNVHLTEENTKRYGISLESLADTISTSTALELNAAKAAVDAAVEQAAAERAAHAEALAAAKALYERTLAERDEARAKVQT